MNNDNQDQITEVTKQRIAPYRQMIIDGFMRHHQLVGKCRLETKGDIVRIFVGDVLSAQMSVERALMYALENAVRKMPELTPARRVNLFSSYTRSVWLVELIDSDTGRQVFSSTVQFKSLGLASAVEHALEEGWIIIYEHHLPEIVEPEPIKVAAPRIFTLKVDSLEAACIITALTNATSQLKAKSVGGDDAVITAYQQAQDKVLAAFIRQGFSTSE